MRSRTRNRHILFSICTLISLPLWGREDYLIGYRLNTHNAIIISENFDASRAMLPCSGKMGKSLTLELTNNQSLLSLLESNKTLFLETFSNETLHIQNYSGQKNMHFQEHTSLTLPTRCYAVEINQDFVTITHIQESQK